MTSDTYPSREAAEKAVGPIISIQSTPLGSWVVFRSGTGVRLGFQGSGGPIRLHLWMTIEAEKILLALSAAALDAASILRDGDGSSLV